MRTQIAGRLVLYPLSSQGDRLEGEASGRARASGDRVHIWYHSRMSQLHRDRELVELISPPFRLLS